MVGINQHVKVHQYLQHHKWKDVLHMTQKQWKWKFEFAVTAIEACAVRSVAFTRFVHLEMLIGLVCNWTT